VFRAEDARVREIYEGRRTTVRQALATGVRTLPARVRKRKERWKGDLQMRHFRAERKLATDLAAADAAYAELSARLSEQRHALKALQKRAWASFYGYWTFQGMVRKARSTAETKTDDPETIFNQFLSVFSTAEQQLAAFRKIVLPNIFRFLPLPL